MASGGRQRHLAGAVVFLAPTPCLCSHLSSNSSPSFAPRTPLRTPGFVYLPTRRPGTQTVHLSGFESLPDELRSTDALESMEHVVLPTRPLRAIGVIYSDRTLGAYANRRVCARNGALANGNHKYRAQPAQHPSRTSRCCGLTTSDDAQNSCWVKHF